MKHKHFDLLLLHDDGGLFAALRELLLRGSLRAGVCHDVMFFFEKLFGDGVPSVSNGFYSFPAMTEKDVKLSVCNLENLQMSFDGLTRISTLSVDLFRSIFGVSRVFRSHELHLSS